MCCLSIGLGLIMPFCGMRLIVSFTPDCQSFLLSAIVPFSVGSWCFSEWNT